jgi:hypothetical protein
MGDCLLLNNKDASYLSYDLVKIAGITRALVKDPYNPGLRCSCILDDAVYTDKDENNDPI